LVKELGIEMIIGKGDGQDFMAEHRAAAGALAP
jgi:hypothetical protein